HAVAERTDLFPANGHARHIEELEVGGRLAGCLLDDLESVRALDLETVGLAVERVGTGAGPLVQLAFHIPFAGVGVRTDPVQARTAACEVELVFSKVEQTTVAADITSVVDGYALLGLVDGEIAERVDTKILPELQRDRTINSESGQVIGLIE